MGAIITKQTSSLSNDLTKYQLRIFSKYFFIWTTFLWSLLFIGVHYYYHQHFTTDIFTSLISFMFELSHLPLCFHNRLFTMLPISYFLTYFQVELIFCELKNWRVYKIQTRAALASSEGSILNHDAPYIWSKFVFSIFFIV